MNTKLLRRTAIIAGIVLTLLVVSGAVFTATFDVNRFKPQIEQAVEARTGRTLRFDGNLGLALFPRLAVTLPATTLSEPKGEAVFARVGSARATIALLPLLRGEIEVGSVRIDGLRATVVKYKDGRTSIDDLLRAQGKGDATGPETAPAASSAPRIGAVQLNDADLTWRDLAAGRTVRLSSLDLQAGRYAPGATMPFEADAMVAVSEPPLAGRVSLEAEFEWNEQGLAAVQDLLLQGEGTLNQQPAKIELRAERIVSAASEFDLRQLKLSAEGRNAAGAPLSVRLTAPRIEVGRTRAASERIEGTIAVAGDSPLDVRLLIEGLRGNAARLEAAPIKIDASMRAAARTMRVAVTAALAGSLDQRSMSLQQANGELVIEDSARSSQPLRLPVSASGALDGKAESATLALQAHGAGLDGRARFSVNGFAAPRVAFEIDAEQIDVDRLSGAAATADAASRAAATGAGTAGGSAPAATDAKVDLSALRGLNASGSVRIGRLRLSGMDAADVRIAAKAAAGRLEAAPVSLRLHGGTVSGRATLDARSNQIMTSGSVKGIDLRRAVGDVGARIAIEGRADGRFELSTAGASVGQMKRALDGTVALDVRDGALVGIDLADLIGTAAGLLQRGRQSGALDQSKRTPFSQMSASVRIIDGVASNDDLKAKSPQLDLSGSGRMDLVTTQLDYGLRAQVTPGPTTERSALRSLIGVTVPVRITGPLERLDYTVDWGAVAADALVKRATGRTVAPAVDQVIEGLGDLFGRRRK